MAVNQQVITKEYALYCGDCMEVLVNLPDNCVHLSVYSPPFGGLYNYSSSERDLSNCKDYAEFFEQYNLIIDQLCRVSIPGRMTAVHCTDVPSGNSGLDHMIDFPGDIIRSHEALGWKYIARYSVWKEPLRVRNRTMAKNLAHKTIVDDSSRCSVASADYLLVFRKGGNNPIPIAHPHGLLEYAGSRQIPSDLLQFKGYTGNQIYNRYSHWIWRQYASAFWDDVRRDRVLPFIDSKDENDEKHVHPLQLDIIDRVVVLWSNPGETILTPFMGVGSETYSAVVAGRRAIGIELKESYFKQAIANMQSIANGARPEQNELPLEIDEVSA